MAFGKSAFFPRSKQKRMGVRRPSKADYSESAMWFYPLGKITGHYDENGELSFDGRRIVGLRKASEKVGSPMMMGRAGKKVSLNSVIPETKEEEDPRAALRGFLGDRAER
jgi:hypothetical protein